MNRMNLSFFYKFFTKLLFKYYLYIIKIAYGSKIEKLIVEDEQKIREEGE